MHKAIEVLTGLYTGSLLDTLITALRKDVFSNLTDTITLFAALAAIALPLAQQTFQWASDKYRSDHLIDYIESSSPIHPKTLNRLLIIYAVLVVAFKFILPLLNDFFFVPIFLLLSAFFIFNVILLIKYLSHGYDMGKGLISVRNKILSSGIDLNRNMYSAVDVAMLSDFESYMLENDPLYTNFSQEFTDIRYAMLKNINTLDESILLAYTKGIRKAISFIPNASSDIKYLRIAHSYVFFVQALICHDSKYFYLLNELTETANSVERSRSGIDKPMLHGLVFQNITSRENWPDGLVEVLIRHFEHLTQTCIDLGDSQQLVYLYKEFNESLGFRENSSGEIGNIFFNNLKSYKHYDRLNELVEKFIEDEEKESFKEEVSKLLHEDEQYNKDLFKTFFQNMRCYKFQQQAKITFNYFLAEVVRNDINIVLSIAELRNPIGSNINMLGYDLIPTSIDDIVCRISKIGDKFEERIFRDEKYHQHLLKGYVVFLIYEICKLVKNKSSGFDFNYFGKLSFREIEKLNNTTNDIVKLTHYLINSQVFSELYFLHALDADEVERTLTSFFADLQKSVVDKIDDLSTNGKLSQEIIDRFYSSIPDVKEVISENSSLFSGKVKLSKYSKVKRVINFDRTSFLPETGVHSDFSRIGHSIVDEHLRYIYEYTFNKTEGFTCDNAWPINYGRLILLSFKQRIELDKLGFKFVKNEIYWPDGSSCPYRQIRTDTYKIVNILPSEPLVQIADMVSPMYEVSYFDHGKKIEWEFLMNIMPYGYKYGQ
ncbi:hypothetical protein ACHQDA_17605 [Vibrio fluvialis]|uniref:hypothetical protein n=1 Tax=Vibrio fluvialis TaxID=676 RepID=UPI0037567C8D